MVDRCEKERRDICVCVGRIGKIKRALKNQKKREKEKKNSPEASAELMQKVLMGVKASLSCPFHRPGGLGLHEAQDSP